MSDNFYYGHGKVLLTSEYFVLEGAKALALPTQLGQKMHISYRPSNNPKLYWKSYDHDEKLWFEAVFELWHFDIVELNEEIISRHEVELLQNILIQARNQNIHFLREEVDIHVTTTLEFPRMWGLGTSSSLIYCIAQWAYISPFELLDKTFGGSGYDIACAQSMGPIVYQKRKTGPAWETVSFNPVFKDQIFFVYLNQKQNSGESVKRFENLAIENKAEIIANLNELTQRFLDCLDINELELLIREHELLIAGALDLPRVKMRLFQDYWGEIKSLGAWGGDFAMVTSNRSAEETEGYFRNRGYDQILSFDEFILQNFSKYNSKAEQLEYELKNVSRPQ